MRKPFFKRKLIWSAIILVFLWQLVEIISVFLMPEIILQNKTSETVYWYEMQTSKWGDFDYYEGEKSRVKHTIKSNKRMRFHPELKKIRANEFVYLYINWGDDKSNGDFFHDYQSFLMHANKATLSSKKENQISDIIFYSSPQKTACRIRIVINEKDYEVIPEKKWFCLKSLTPIRFIYTN